VNAIVAMAPGQRISDWLFFSVSGLGFVILLVAVIVTHRPVSFLIACVASLALHYFNYRLLWGLTHFGGSDETYYGFADRVLHIGLWIVGGLIALKFLIVFLLVWRRRRLARLSSLSAPQTPKYDY
jgi:hypothetical protein